MVQGIKKAKASGTQTMSSGPLMFLQPLALLLLCWLLSETDVSQFHYLPSSGRKEEYLPETADTGVHSDSTGHGSLSIWNTDTLGSESEPHPEHMDRGWG